MEQAIANLLTDTPRIDGVAFVAGQAPGIFKNLTATEKEKLLKKGAHFVSFPIEPPSGSPYKIGSLTSEQYPQLIKVGHDVRVWSVPSVLVSFDWESKEHRDPSRAERIRLFVNAFFDYRYKILESTREKANWCSVDISAVVYGWNRLHVATDWLKAHKDANPKFCPDELKVCPHFPDWLAKQELNFEHLNREGILHYFEIMMKEHRDEC